MTKDEWLNIGYSQGLIDDKECLYIFDDVYNFWFNFKLQTIKYQSCDRINCTYRKFFNDFKNYKINEITNNRIISFINFCINQGITRKTFNAIFQIVRNVLDYSIDIESCVKNYDIDVCKKYIAYEKLLKNTNSEIAINQDCMINIINYLVSNSDKNKIIGNNLVLLDIYTGLRLGELISLKWSDISFNDNYIFVNSTLSKSYYDNGIKQDKMIFKYQDTTKTPHGVRYVPLTNGSRYALDNIKKYQLKNGIISDFISCDGTDRNIYYHTIKCFKNACRKTCVRTYNFHLIRKTFATGLHKSGVSTRNIADILGHSDIRTTESCYIIGYEYLNNNSLYDSINNMWKT